MSRGDEKQRTRAVYTALFGGYEQLVSQPIARSTDVDFICFTDNSDLQSDDWEVRVIPRPVFLDPVRSARFVKIKSHPSLAQYDETLWIDNRVVLKSDPATILDSWLSGGYDVAMPHHDHRQSVDDEFREVLASGFDLPTRIREQWGFMRKNRPSVLLEHPAWTAIIARRNTAEVRDLGEFWMNMVLKYSRRDQLSVNLALDEVSVKWRLIELPNWESPIHRWLTAEELPKDPTVRFAGNSEVRYSAANLLRDSLRRSEIRRLKHLWAKQR